MKYAFVCGGTGGHIYPAIAIADRIRKLDENAEINFFGASGGFESKIVPKAGYNFILIHSKGIDRSDFKKLPKELAENIKGISEAKMELKRLKPDVVIGTGGYTSFPVITAAAKLGIPCYLHEQNAFPGVANKILEKKVETLFLGFEAARDRFKDKSKLIYSGNPVRDSFKEITKESARKKLGIPKDDFVIFSFGGSLGSLVINGVMESVIEKFKSKDDITMIMGTGRPHLSKILDDLKQKEIVPNEKIRVLDYIDDMDQYMMASDVIISRAGALTIGEITLCGKVGIFIPAPNVAENHQYFNAKAVSDMGGAFLVEEKDLDYEKIGEYVKNLEEDKELLKKMSLASRSLAKDDSLDIITEKILSDIK